MRILIETHHPGDIHFWKFPVRELLANGHHVLVMGRDRDVMRRLLASYPWIPSFVPPRATRKNRFPLREMIFRQWHLLRTIYAFNPEVVTSLFGSYCQGAAVMGCRNIIFTDSEFQHFNHTIAHPFADEVHTPYCFYKDLGPKQRFYKGIHELAFLDGQRFRPDPSVLRKYRGFEPSQYVVIRLSAWNTFHDIHHQGIGPDIVAFINRFKDRWKIVISAEENQLPEGLRPYAMQFLPEEFHDVLAFARFVLSEGASTASESACLGIPTVYINSTEPRGYLGMLESKYGLVKNFACAKKGLPVAIKWLEGLEASHLEELQAQRHRLIADHCDVTAHVVKVLTKGGS